MTLRLLLLVALSLGPLVAAPTQHRGDRGLSSAALASPSDASTLRAIAIVEDWQGRPGRRGEIGPWQMMPKTWASYTGTAEERAVKHLDWLKRGFARRGIDPIPFNIALAWNCGFAATAAGRAPDVSFDYACRVVATLEAGR